MGRGGSRHSRSVLAEQLISIEAIAELEAAGYDAETQSRRGGGKRLLRIDDGYRRVAGNLKKPRDRRGTYRAVHTELIRVGANIGHPNHTYASGARRVNRYTVPLECVHRNRPRQKNGRDVRWG